MSRITAALKQQIVETLVERATKERQIALKRNQFELADRLYARVYSEAMRKEMLALPDGWLPEVSQVQLATQPWYEIFYFEHPHRIPRRDEDYGQLRIKTLSVDEEMCVRALLDEQKAAGDYERELRDKIRGILEACSTWKKLFTVWPESHDALKQLEPDSSGNLPAVIPQQLNTELGLP